MAHFAEIDSENKVISVLKVPDDQEHRGNEFLSQDCKLGGTWIQTSYNTFRGIHRGGGIPLRKNYAAIGYTYDAELDAFIPPKPYSSWTLDEGTADWYPPVKYPSNGKRYVWNESIVSWTPHPENAAGPYRWNTETYSWSFMPLDGKKYTWDERTNSWIEIPSP